MAIGQAARTCAMYRELLEVARRYQNDDEVERLSRSLANADTALSRLIARALEDNETTPPPDSASTPDAPQARVEDDDDAVERDAGPDTE